jgi:hypothetical protein
MKPLSKHRWLVMAYLMVGNSLGVIGLFYPDMFLVANTLDEAGKQTLQGLQAELYDEELTSQVCILNSA